MDWYLYRQKEDWEVSSTESEKHKYRTSLGGKKTTDMFKDSRPVANEG